MQRTREKFHFRIVSVLTDRTLLYSFCLDHETFCLTFDSSTDAFNINRLYHITKCIRGKNLYITKYPNHK